MELRYKMTDILPLLPIPQPPMGKSSYHIPCPFCDSPGSREKHLNINLKKNVYRCPKCGQMRGGVFDLYAFYMNVPRDQVQSVLEGRGSPKPRDIVLGSRKNRIPPPPAIPQAELANAQTRDKVYRALLSKLTLASDHRTNLLGRGLTDEAIAQYMYRTTPSVALKALAQSLIEDGLTLFGVPGFYRDEADGRWSLALYRRGIFIPCITDGKIQSLQIRLDKKMRKGGKFLTFSSTDLLDGARAENWCHMVGPLRERILLIEGYMKADIVHYFTGETVLAIPGVTSVQHLKSILEELSKLGLRHVMTCFDMDYLRNWHVEGAYINLVQMLGELDITFGTYLWHPEYNGLDDYIWEFCLGRSLTSPTDPH